MVEPRVAAMDAQKVDQRDDWSVEYWVDSMDLQKAESWADWKADLLAAKLAH